MKRKTNISVQDNRGIRVTPNMHVGEEFHGYIPGDILDANTIVKLIYDAIAGLSIDGQDLQIGSQQIIDKSVLIEDLSDEIVDKLNTAGMASYLADGEILELNNTDQLIN